MLARPNYRSIGCTFRRIFSVAASTAPDDVLYSDIPRLPRTKSERKPYLTPMNVLIQRAKEERETRKLQPCRKLENPPGNGLLVPELVPVAWRIYRARESLLKSLTQLIRSIPVQRCQFCSEVHIGHSGHEIRTCTGPGSGLRRATHVWKTGGVHDIVSFPKCFHLYDRVGKPRIVHDERHSVPRIPALLELCIQCGVDINKYPCKRRSEPVYSIEGRIVDFETVALEDGREEETLTYLRSSVDEVPLEHNPTDKPESLKDLSNKALESWFEMVRGTKQIMETYTVWTCGYCPEVQVGPKGHKVRMCKASKHQSRNGLHAWQEATIYDLIGHNHVWHVRDLSRPELDNKLKRFYGKAPAIVELCVQGGANIPKEFRSMMRVDVVPPDQDEVDLVA